MNDREISGLWALSIACWSIGLILVVLEMLYQPARTGHLGIFATMAGATIQVRSWFSRMCQREAEAFKLGREYEGTVRTIR